jgi:MFS family permease
MPDENPKQGKRNVVWMGIASFFNDIGSEMILPVLPLFLTAVLGVGTAFLGVIEGVAESASNIIKVFSGRLSDRLNRRKGLVISGYSLSTAAKPLIALATRGSHVLFARFFDRLGKGIRTSPRDSLIAASTTPEIRGKYFGIHRMLDTLGAVIGATAAMILLWLTTNYRLIFWLSLIPAVISLAVVVLFVKEVRSRANKGMVRFSLKGLDPRFRLFLIVSAVFSIGQFSYAFLIVRAQDIGIAIALIPLMYIVYNIVSAAVNVPAGILSDRIGRRSVLAFSYLLFAAGSLALGLAKGKAWIWLAFILYGVFIAIHESIPTAFVSDLVKPGNRGTALGIYGMTVGISALPASVLVGWLWQAVNVQTAFMYSAGTSLLALVLILVLLRR